MGRKLYANGSNIHLKDSASSKVVELGLYGKAEQKQYSGKQLIPYPYKYSSGQIVGITYNSNDDDGSMNLNIPLENLFGTLFMFLPLGIYLPFFHKKIDSLKKCILSILPIFLVIEIAQFLTKRGAFDIDDLILNLAGAVIGYLIWNSNLVQGVLEKCIGDRVGI